MSTRMYTSHPGLLPSPESHCHSLYDRLKFWTVFTVSNGNYCDLKVVAYYNSLTHLHSDLLPGERGREMAPSGRGMEFLTGPVTALSMWPVQVSSVMTVTGGNSAELPSRQQEVRLLIQESH